MKALFRTPGRATCAAALAAALLVAPTSAEAAGHANNFGDKGQLIISADRLLPVFSFTHASFTDTPNGVDLTTSRSGSGISFFYGRNLASPEATLVTNNDFLPINVHTIPRIAADFTVIQHLTVGAGLVLAFGLGGTDKTDVIINNVKTTQEADSPSSTAIGFVPRVGYIIPVGDILAFWPRGGLGFYSTSTHFTLLQNNNPNQPTESRSITDTIISLDLDPMLAIVPLEHFFFLVGPMINIPLSGTRSAKLTQGATTTTVSNDISLFNFGIEGSLGFWFNLL
jgi:hypothetical protein